jgi:hypothetical protein
MTAADRVIQWSAAGDEACGQVMAASSSSPSQARPRSASAALCVRQHLRKELPTEVFPPGNSVPYVG